MRNSVFFLLISISSGLASFHYPTWSTESVAHFSSGSLWSGVTDQCRKAKICHTDSVVAVAAVAERLMGGGGGGGGGRCRRRERAKEGTGAAFRSDASERICGAGKRGEREG